jgi:hypothetical protein
MNGALAIDVPVADAPCLPCRHQSGCRQPNQGPKVLLRPAPEIVAGRAKPSQVGWNQTARYVPAWRAAEITRTDGPAKAQFLPQLGQRFLRHFHPLPIIDTCTIDLRLPRRKPD